MLGNLCVYIDFRLSDVWREISPDKEQKNLQIFFYLKDYKLKLYLDDWLYHSEKIKIQIET